MKLSHRQEGDKQVIFVGEELGHHEARQIISYANTTLALYPEGDVVLDLTELTFMDSSGLAVALHLYKMANRNGRAFTIRGTKAQAMRVFRAAGIPKMMHFEGE